MSLPPPRAESTCLVTGASSGIGLEIASELARRGYGVTLVARREAKLIELARHLHAAHGVRVEVAAADLTEAGSRCDVVDRIAALDLAVQLLVNNAGFSTSGRTDRAGRGRELAMVRTNVEAVVDLCVLVAPQMVERGSGAILNTASTAAFQPLPGQAGYGASKAFVLSYSWALSAELRGKGITVTALCPGPVATEFADTAGFDEREAEHALPRFLWVPAADVARAAVDGLDQGKAVVIPGSANRLLALAAQYSPRSAILPIVARQHPAMKRA